MLAGLNHANISTDRLAETVAFFTDALGLRVGPRPAFPFAGAWLYLGEQAVIHLVERETPREPKGAIDHVAFTAPDLDAMLARLSAMDIPWRLVELPSGFGRQAFVTDPNGVTIEMTEPGGA